MEWNDILSIIGMYILTQIFVCGAHMFAALMDNVLYEANKYNENRKTKRIGMAWLFWRLKKDDKKEIFSIAFVHEIISVFLFLVVTFMFILTLVLNKEIIMYLSFVPIIIYFLYAAIRQRHIARKIKINANSNTN